MYLSETEFEAYLTESEQQRLQSDPNLRTEIFDHLSQFELPDFDESNFTLDESLKNVLVFANLPRVPESKFAKLLRFLEKVTAKFGSAEISMPTDTDKVSLGVAIVSFSRISEALKALRDLQDFELDADHKLKIFPFDDAVDSLVSATSTSSPEMDASSGSPSSMMADRAGLADFMQDARYREELLVRWQAETQICWWDSLDSGEPLQVEYAGERMGGKKWCEGNAFFSPRGSFVVTLHPGRGVQLWGGLDFERKSRFLHSHVKDVLFAPDEEHLLVIGNSDVDDPEAVKLFNVLTGELVRVFPAAGSDFQWSGSGRLLGRILERTLFVYGGPEFKPLLDGGKLLTAKYVNCTQFAFAPSAPDVVAVWTSEGANVPARLAVAEVSGEGPRPLWREVGSKTFFSTEGEAVVEWSPVPSGGSVSLVVRTSRLLKKAGTTKKIGTSIDLFTYVGGACTSCSIDLGADGGGLKCVRTFAGAVAALWEKTLVVYRTDKEKGLLVEQTRLSLAGVGGSGGACALDKMAVSQFGYVVLYGCSGDLVFVSLGGGGAEILRVDQHYLVNRVVFDASGRFVLTAVVQKMHDESSMAFRYQQEAGFAIWTFQGRPLHKWKKERLYNVEWRPHTVSMLEAEEKKKILAELKLRERKIEEEEEAMRGLSRDSVERSITEKRNSFYAALAKVDAYFLNATN